MRTEKMKRNMVFNEQNYEQKKIKFMKRDMLDELPDDLVTCILRKLSFTANSPADFISILLTCKRLNQLGLSPMVSAKSSMKMLSVRPRNWCESAQKFLKQCADSGNVHACYILGMIRFYCLQNRGGGASLLAKAAINSHAEALYSLAVIQFNGSGGSKNDKDLRAGVALCARAAFFGHVDALRELGHCLQDGYGVRQNVAEGRRFLVQANARELASVLSVQPWNTLALKSSYHILGGSNGPVVTCPLLSDFGCSVPTPEPHPANQFLTEWFSARAGILESGLRMCSHEGCGRPETRKHEFRRCSVCGTVNYCSRACQALNWKMRHKGECVPLERLVGDEGNNGVGDGAEEGMVLS